jgi:capsular exopolysaccharide synthesis family protein
MVRKHWRFAIGTALVVTLVVTFYTLGQTKIYQASATVQFDPTPPRPLGKEVQNVVELGAGDYWNNREYYETQYKMIQSMRVALTVVRNLHLDQDAGFLDNSPPGRTSAPRTVSHEDAALVLRSRVRVEPVKDSRLANILYEDADPPRAQRIVNTLADAYVEQNMDLALDSTTDALDWLRAQLANLKKDLESNELALHEYKINKNILSVAFDDQSNMLREQMRQVNEALTSVRTKREALTARRNELKQVLDDPKNLPATELLQSQLLQQLRQRYEEALKDRDALIGEGKGSAHPDVAAASAKANSLKQALLAEVHNIHGAVEREVNAVSGEEAGLSRLFEAAKKQALDLNLLEIEYNRLKRSKENTEKLYQLVLERTKESDLTRMMRVNNIRTVDHALLPRGPIRPRVGFNIMLGLMTGLLLGVFAGISRAMLDRTVKTPDDIEHELGLTCLGLLPQIGSGGHYARNGKRPKRRIDPSGPPEISVHTDPSSGLAEAARALRTNLMFSSPDKPYRTILVTSAAPAEGKTTVACCIAIAMAQAGQKVLLVDCDLRRPRMHRIFHKPSDIGLTTALFAPDELDSAATPTEIPNLSVLPAGPIPPNPAELLHSEAFTSLLKELGRRYDRIILDSPPIVAVTDATVLSTLVDGVLLVVRGFSTSIDVVRFGAKTISEVSAKLTGVILNAINLDHQEYKYYYYYYRRSGYYGADVKSTNGAGEASPPLG